MTTLTRQELLTDIEQTMHEIGRLKQQLEQCTDKKEKRRLQRRVMELQYQQLWRHDLLDNDSEKRYPPPTFRQTRAAHNAARESSVFNFARGDRVFIPWSSKHQYLLGEYNERN